MISPERKKFAEDAVSRGTFMFFRMHLWRGKILRRIDCLPGKSPKPRAIGKFDGQLAFTRRYYIPWFSRKQGWMEVRLLMAFKDYAYRTRFGWFVPDCGMDPIDKALAGARAEIAEINLLVSNDYDRLRQDLMAAHSKAVPSIWTDGFGYTGEPTQNFRDEEMRRYMQEFPSKEVIISRNYLTAYPYSPLVDASMPCSKHVDPAEQNTAVYRAVYDSVIARRRRLAYVAVAQSERLQIKVSLARRAIFRKFMGFRRGMFWEEPELLRMVASIQDMVMVRDNVPATREELDALAGLVKYLFDHQFFRMLPNG